MEDQELQQLMSSIYNDIHHTVLAWEAYRELRTKLSEEDVPHTVFFPLVMRCLVDSVIMACTRVADRDDRAMSIPNVLKRFGNDIVALEEMDRRLSDDDTTFQRIKQRRDQHIAHQDAQKDYDPLDPLTADQMEKFVRSLEKDFQQLDQALQNTYSDFAHQREIARRATAWQVDSYRTSRGAGSRER